ncbi:fluoride efflux transporter CrcB [Nitratireductor sp. CH_MIT9313-5]|uniref:fluoride efflux transporter CrcB n=1 Tax=Nitratireductor sp. CH_MIT9313-5 TaxID=3107764 RepID=UPI0030087765
MVNVLLVFLGGGAGAGLRYLSVLWISRLFGAGFPAGTMVVNVAGSFAMGLLVGYLARRAEGVGEGMRLLLATGFLGGFTTFSAYSLDFAALWERQAVIAALSYAVASVILSLFAVFGGLWLARSFP